MEQALRISGAFLYPPQEKVIFGQGSLRQLSAEVDRLGGRRVFVITFAKETDPLNRVQEVLGPVSGSTWDFVLARVAIDYRRELTQADDAVVVRSTVERIGNSSITLCEEIRTVSGELAAEAEAVLVARDQETGRSRALTEAERAAFGSQG